MRHLQSFSSKGASEPARAVELIRYFSGKNNSSSPGTGPPPYRMTGLGAWASSRPAHLYYFFRRVNLSGFKLLIDLGSGDGTAALIASLFTRAVGLESEPELVAAAARSARDLRIDDRVRFICADFFTQRIEEADCLFIYPDKPVYALEDRLQGWSGTLLIYGPHFPPLRMIPNSRFKCGKETLAVYRNT